MLCSASLGRLSSVIRLVVVLSVLPGTPGEIAGQQSGPSDTFIAIADDFPEVDARSLLVREPGRDLVVLRASEATVEVLAMSLAVLERVRTNSPLAAGQGQMIPISGFATTRPPSDRVERRLAAVLERLGRSATAEMGSLGPGRWIRLR